MELETKEFLMTMGETIDRLNAAAAQLERTASSLEQREAAVASLITGDVRKIVAAVEHETVEHKTAESSQREAELERRLAQAEQRIAELTAGHEATTGSARSAALRKTLPAATTQLLAKQGITSLESIEAGALDAALAGLSLEQRIAVKSQLFRAGALS